MHDIKTPEFEESYVGFPFWDLKRGEVLQSRMRIRMIVTQECERHTPAYWRRILV